MINPKMNQPKVISVSQLNFYVKSIFENDMNLNAVFITGEISNLTDHYKSGHIYLSLKDEKSVIRAVMFAGNARNLKFQPKNGMKILACGRVSVYEPTGQYQLYIEHMQPDGIGALNLAYEQLKEKLANLGLFDKTKKKPIPKFPQNVGVITSPTGAAVQDIMNILKRRYPKANIIMYPVLVQGDSAPAQLVKAIDEMDFYNLADVIIIGRGGGSIEDLWAFNSEELAFAIYNCKTPVISAVGHETDFTICDFVADLRAPTPSAAAELAVPDIKELHSYFESKKRYAESLMKRHLQKEINTYNRNIDALNYYSPSNIKERRKQKLALYIEKMQKLMALRIQAEKDNLAELTSELEGANPVAVLKRGFAYAKKDSKVVTSSKELKTNDEFELIFDDGKINAKVIGE